MGATARLLILDDDPAVGQAIGLIAESTDLEWRATITPADFFRELEQWQPGHIALDLVMPEMDGVEVMRQLAERSCRARIIITSGVGSRILDAARRSAAEHGLDIAGVLPKPFSSASLRKLLGEQAGNSEPPATRSGIAHADEFEITEEEVRNALETRVFILAYQPKIECTTGNLAGFEALVRWNHPELGIVMPDRFIPFAERNGLIGALTEQVFDQALRWFSSSFPLSRLSLSVNISAKNLVDFKLGDRIASLCRQLLINPSNLIFELTETSAMAEPVASLDLLTRLRMKGFQLSIDDFGTGYSSMAQLVRLPFSEIKVDKSFVMAATHSKEARTVVKSIIDLGHSLGLRVTAEGVEDAETLKFLNDVGCDLAQGFFIARPMTGDKLVEWVERRGTTAKVPLSQGRSVTK